MSPPRIPHIPTLIILASVLLGTGCGSTTDGPAPSAVDECRTAPDTTRLCTQQYEPVCGCDGRTYGNACTARAAGILRATEGACGEQDNVR